MSAQRENKFGAISKRLRAFGAFAGGTPAVPAILLRNYGVSGCPVIV